MKTSTRSAFVFALLLASAAYAQKPSLDGNWTGQAVAGNGTQVKINLTITGASGKMRLLPSSNGYTVDPCYERDIPVAVESQGASDMALAIKGESVLKGCLNETVKLKIVDAKNVSGTLKDGRTITMSRK